MDDPVLWYEGGGFGDPRWLQSDERGSIVAVSATGVLGVNGYDDYGEPGTGNVGRFQYTGQAWLGELGLYHYKARLYSPALGRFLQTDPVGYQDQVNLYAYVGNDPLNHADPTGTCTGSLIENGDGSCKGSGAVNPGLSGAGTSTGALPGHALRNANAAAGATASDGLNGEAGTPGDEPQNGQDAEAACAADPSSCITVVAQRGGQNQRATEFQNLNDQQVKEAYDAAKGEARVKLQRELKARGLHGGGKVRGGGIFRIEPLLIIPAIELQMYLLNCKLNPQSDPSCSVT